MKNLIEINDPKEQQAVVDGFAEFFIRHTGNPMLAFLFVIIQLEKLSEYVFVIASAMMALLALFSYLAQPVVPYWVCLVYVTAVLLLLKKGSYWLSFGMMRRYAGIRSIEDYFAYWGRLNDKLKQHIERFNETGRALPKQKPSEICNAYQKCYQATGHKGCAYVALSLGVLAALTMADWYIILPAAVLMIVYHAPFFAAVFWGAMAIASIGSLLVIGLLRFMQFQMQRHPCS